MCQSLPAVYPLEWEHGVPMQARSEVYLGVFKKHLCFLPGLPFGVQMGRWCLPQTEMQTLATCVRKLARLLWTLHLTFQEVPSTPFVHSACWSRFTTARLRHA